MNTTWTNILRQGLFLSTRGQAMFGFALRTWLASMLALYIAFALQLDSPFWAWLTVWIVAQPTAGMLLSKSLYRVIGTVAGAAIAIVLISLFAQTPELFVLALALLVGGCTVASNTLTNFRAYATVLAAYTAGIVASDAINSPNQIFFIAVARSSSILIGIASAVVVTSIFAPHRAEEGVRGKLLEALKDAARRAAFPWQGDNETRLRIGRKLIIELVALDTLIEFAAAESGVFRLQANNARSMLAHIFGLISARRALDAHLHRCGWPRHHALEIFHEVILEFLHEMPGQLERGKVNEVMAGLEEVHAQLAVLEPERDTAAANEVVSERFVIDRLEDFLRHLHDALSAWQDILEEKRNNSPRLVLNFHRDVRAAWINGLRAFLAVSATGTFWIGTAWTHGPLALIFVAVMMSLFSSYPRPDRVGWAFFYASVPALFFAVVCKFLVLPMGAGFEFLTLAMGLFLIPLGLVMANPSTNAPAVAFSLVFLNLVQPTNLMTYDLADTLNSGIAIEVGVLFGTLAYVLIFPPNPAAARRYVTERIRRGLEMLARLNPIPSFSSWETRMYDRVIRLNDPQNLSGTPTDEWLDAGLGALNLGNEILRLRCWLATEKLSADLYAVVERFIQAFSRFCREPQRAAAEVKTHLVHLSQLDPGVGGQQRRTWARILGALTEIDSYLGNNPRLLKIKESLSS